MNPAPPRKGRDIVPVNLAVLNPSPAPISNSDRLLYPSPVCTGVMHDRIDEFRDAVENDEYCGIELETGDYLVTDWEGDGTFNPYVVPTADRPKTNATDRMNQAQIAIADATGVVPRNLHYSAQNNCFIVDMDRP